MVHLSPPPPLLLASSWNDNSRYSDNNSSWRWVSLAAFAGLLGVSTVWFRGLVMEYGLEGALKYIWEGDPYPDLRDQLDKLDDIQDKTRKQETVVGKLETALERARLDTIDGPEPSSLVDLWRTHLPRSLDLRTRLGLLSSDLDKLAASVDGVASQGSDMLRERKKALSTRIVRVMDRVDALILVFRQGTAQQDDATTTQ